MRLIVGLGNPGKEYENTAHNLGFKVVEALGEELGARFRRSLRLKSRVARGRLNDAEVLLLKPQTYMNRSGQAVAAALRYYRIEPADLVVVTDDADLDLGMVRIRPHGGSGGHRGLGSIIEHIGCEDFVRIRLGIGRGTGLDLVDHVLSPLTREQDIATAKMVTVGKDAIESIIESSIEAAMNRFNRKQSREQEPG